MPRLVVDLSARSKIIREEPYDLHFWEMTPARRWPSYETRARC